MSAVFIRYDPSMIPLGVQIVKRTALSISHSLQTNHPRKGLDSFALNHRAHWGMGLIMGKQVSVQHRWAVALILVAHAAVIYWVVSSRSEIIQAKPVLPLTVSLIAPPAVQVEPEVVPLIKPIQVEKKPIIKSKRMVEKVMPIDNPDQPLFEASTVSVIEVKTEAVEATSEPVAIQATSKPAIIEERIDLPKFGVAYLNNPAPEYPKLAKRMGEEGRVILKVLVSATGLSETVSVERSSGFERLDQAAIDAVKQWRFVPARKGGQALSAFVLVPLKFSLTD